MSGTGVNGSTPALQAEGVGSTPTFRIPRYQNAERGKAVSYYAITLITAHTVC